MTQKLPAPAPSGEAPSARFEYKKRVESLAQETRRKAPASRQARLVGLFTSVAIVASLGLHALITHDYGLSPVTAGLSFGALCIAFSFLKPAEAVAHPQAEQPVAEKRPPLQVVPPRIPPLRADGTTSIAPSPSERIH